MECHNQGAPFDNQTASAVLSDLTDAGLWDGAPVDDDRES